MIASQNWPRFAGTHRVPAQLAWLIVAILMTMSTVAGARLVTLGTFAAAATDAQTLSQSDWEQINDLLYAGSIAATGATFINEAHGLSAQVTSSGTRVVADGGEVALSFTGIGRGASTNPPVSSAAPSVTGNRIETIHALATGSVSEWWVNASSGLEQGFTFAMRPAGDGVLRIGMDLTGSLAPILAAPDVIGFEGSDLRFAGLVAWDAAGREFEPRFELHGGRLSIVVDDAGASYPLTVDPTFTQQAYFKASNTETQDNFGWSLAIDGDTMVVGAPLEDSNANGVDGNEGSNAAPEAGAAYVFVRDGTTWTQQAYLKASNSEDDDEFGTSVAIDGNTIVVGAPLEDSDATGVDGDDGDNSELDSGAAYVFARSGVTWSQQAYLKASNTDAGDEFGFSVAVTGDTIIVGGPEEDGSGTGLNPTSNEAKTSSGAAYVFTRSGATWTHQVYVKPSTTQLGERFGYAVAADGDTFAVGARAESSDATLVGGDESDTSAGSAGAVFVFTGSLASWSQQAYVKASNTDAGDNFGSSVSLSGDTLVVGATSERSNATGVDGDDTNNSLSGAGAAYIYQRSGAAWSFDAYLKASNTGAGDQFGGSVAIDGNMVVIAADGEGSLATGIDGDQTDNSNPTTGAAYAFTPVGSSWGQQAYIKASNTGPADAFGKAVAVSGDTILSGAYAEDSAATGINGDQNQNPPAVNSGAAYAIHLTPEFVSQAYLKASNTDLSDKFGTAVAVSGDTVVVGAPWEQSTNGLESNDSGAAVGAAYVFTRTGSTWSQQAYLKASNAESGDNFGASVAISGDTIVVGAFGEDGANTGVDSIPNDIGSSNGAAYVFKRSGSTWTQEAYLKPTTTDDGDFFGQAVAISGDTVVVGSWDEDSGSNLVNGNEALNGALGAGAAWVFSRTGTEWDQDAYLKASNSNAGDHFGWSVAVSGDTIVVGADDEASADANNQLNNGAGESGAAYVFRRSAGIWAQEAYLKSPDIGGGDNFGWSVAIAGINIIVGAPNEDTHAAGVHAAPNESSSNSGAAFIFRRDGGTWEFAVFLKASNTEPDDNFGHSVGIGVDVAVVSALGEDSNSTLVDGDDDDNTASSSGAIYSFHYVDGDWAPGDYLKASNTDATDLFGASLGISGDTVVAGAYQEDSAATGVNGDGADDTATDAGAAYVITDEGCIGPPFIDVPVDHAFCPEIRWMAINEISTGFNDGSYQPSVDVTRQAMSAFMARLADASLTACAVAPFTDVPTTHPFCPEIQWMKDEGISTGFGDGTYKPSIDVTRQAMSAFMARLADAQLTACAVPPFSDVPISHPFCSEIQWMKNAGVSTGFADGTYKPSIDVTRQAMSAFLYRVSVFVD